MKQQTPAGSPAPLRGWEEVYIISLNKGRLKKASAVVYPLSIHIPQSVAAILSSVPSLLPIGDGPSIVAGITEPQDKSHIDSIIKATFSGGLKHSHPAAFPFLSQALTAYDVPNVLDSPLSSYYSFIQHR